MSSFFIKYSFAVFHPLLGSIPSLVLYCFLIVSPIAYYMGQSLPLLIGSLKWKGSTAQISGNALYLSTIGSFFGAIITTNVFLYIFGASYTLLIVCVTALIIGFYLVDTTIYRLFSLCSIVLACMFSALIPRHIGMISTAFADITIISNGNERTLVANNTYMSRIRDNSNGFWYMAEFQRYVNRYVQNKSIIILGAGGFVAHLDDKNNNRYTYVDVDRELKHISETLFLKQPINHQFVVDDARAYMLSVKSGQELVFLDVFSSQVAIPSHLVSHEFFGLIKSKLNIGGVLIINSIIDPTFKDRYSIGFHMTVTSIFPFCELIKNSNKPTKVANVMYFCTKHSNEQIVYRDDNNQNEFDYWMSQ